MVSNREISRFRPGIKVWLSTSDVQGAFGDGKWRLLEAVESTGSLRAAADSLGISYRKAWGDLKKAESCLGAGIIEKRRGGRTRGGTQLTAAGRRWVRKYARFRRDVDRAVEAAFGEMMNDET